MSNIVVEGKKISSLSLAMDIKEDAIVTIVQDGVTMKMRLSLLIQKIEERTVGKDSTIINRIAQSEEAAKNAEKAAKEVGGALNDFQNSVGNSFETRDKTINAMKRGLDGVAYYKNVVTMANNTDDMVMGSVIDMTDLAIGDTFDYEASLKTDTSARGMYVLHFDVKKGDIFEAGEEYMIAEAGKAPYVVIADSNHLVIDLVTIEKFQTDGYTFQHDGHVYISAMQPESANQIVFYHKEPVDITALVDRVEVLEKNFDGMKTNTVPDLQAEMDEIMEALKNNGII